jgi:poly-D-alanine transfer protein DltD
MVFSLQFFPVTTTGCTKIFVQPVILTSLFFHVLFFLPTALLTMMANDAQEETSHDMERRVQQFIKGTIEMQNDDRFKGLTSEARNM